MNRKRKISLISTGLAVLLLAAFSVNIALASTEKPILTINKNSPFYVGVTFGGNTTADAKLLIDKVKSYTNLFVIQSGPVSKNETALTQISTYAIAAGLKLIVYFGYIDTHNPWQLSWLDAAKQQFGSSLLGVYLDDEPNGIPLDYNWTGYFTTQKLENSTVYQTHAFAIDGILNGTYPHDYNQAAEMSQNAIERNLAPLKNSSLTIFTSDYVLYWFGYKGGYDVMLTQLGWNESITQNIDLIRGAAQTQNKDWGAIITWKYDQPPYLDTGDAVYNQMLTAYEAGAKYVILFNYPQLPGDPYGTLQPEHFEALQKFWYTINTGPNADSPQDFSQAQAVLILPANYGFGLRRPDDRIWGYWGPDEKSVQVWNITQTLVSTYDLRLNIVYEDPAFPVADKYQEVYYWNQTIGSNGLVLPVLNSYENMSLKCVAMMSR